MQRAALSSKMVEEPRDRERKKKVSTHTSIPNTHIPPSMYGKYHQHTCVYTHLWFIQHKWTLTQRTV